MKFSFLLLFGVMLSLFCTACDHGEEGLDLTHFRYDLVTCRHDDGQLLFLRDDTVLLCPREALAADLMPIDERVLIGYSPVGEITDRRLDIDLQTSIAPVTGGKIEELSQEAVETLADDPIYLTSVWCSGGYVNVRYMIEYHDLTHSLAMVALLPRVGGDTLDLQLLHDTRGDAPGYYASGYASYLLPRPLSPVVRVRINTSNLGGSRQFVLRNE